MRRLILEYTLEPAGSHGVWGLDDHSFLPYIFGSAQLSRPIGDNEPMPVEGSAPGAPEPSAVVNIATVNEHRDANMYFSAIGFINDVKKGPFWEHSRILFDISGIRDGWGKINKGMMKMFNAEVLSKYPVIQHFPFGSLFSWQRDAHAAVPAKSVHMASQPTASAATANAKTTGVATSRPQPPNPPGATAAPWAQQPSTRAPVLGGTTQRGGPVQARVPPVLNLPVARIRDPDLGLIPKGKPGTAGNQHAITKAPWAE